MPPPRPQHAAHQTGAATRRHIPLSPLTSPTPNGYQGPAQQNLPDEDGEDEVDPPAVVTGKRGRGGRGRGGSKRHRY